MTEYTYTQYKKTIVRHTALSYATALLTRNRGDAACVGRNYVRNVYDYFTLTEDDNTNKKEALKVNWADILDWENLHDAYCGVKRPSELNVCYLCGPEPNNDFEEMISLGILPQNIWAFETDKKAYRRALSVYENESCKRPRIIKQNIETFFAQTPKKFDIIYIDACGSIPSDQHALRCISSIFLQHRLESPGIIISNFAEPNKKELPFELLTQYFHAKQHPTFELTNITDKIEGTTYRELKKAVSNDFDKYYGDFISMILRDIPATIIPLQRFWKNPYLKQIINTSNSPTHTTSTEEIAKCANDSLAKFFLAYDFMNASGFDDPKTKLFMQEIGDYSTLIKALIEFQLLKIGKLELVDDLKPIYNSSLSPTLCVGLKLELHCIIQYSKQDVQ